MSKNDKKLEIVVLKNPSSHGYNITNVNRVVLFKGNKYVSLFGAMRGIRTAKRYMADPLKYVLRKKSFSLRAGNNREIGRSPEMDPEQLKLAMAALQKYGADAPIVKGY